MWWLIIIGIGAAAWYLTKSTSSGAKSGTLPGQENPTGPLVDPLDVPDPDNYYLTPRERLAYANAVAPVENWYRQMKLQYDSMLQLDQGGRCGGSFAYAREYPEWYQRLVAVIDRRQRLYMINMADLAWCSQNFNMAVYLPWLSRIGSLMDATNRSIQDCGGEINGMLQNLNRINATYVNSDSSLSEWFTAHRKTNDLIPAMWN